MRARTAYSLCLLLAATSLGAGSVLACDVCFVAGDSNVRPQFVIGRDCRQFQHYVVLSPSGQCAGMALGLTTYFDRSCVVGIPGHQTDFLAHTPSGTVGYIVRCQTSCLPNLTSGRSASIVGYLSGTKELDGYVVTGGGTSLAKFIAGCSTSVVRGFLVSDQTRILAQDHAGGDSANIALRVVSRSSYIKDILVGRPSSAIPHYTSSSGGDTLTHMLTGPSAAVRQFVAGYPSSHRVHQCLNPDASKGTPSFIAGVQCED